VKKLLITETYKIQFDLKTGVEILEGINGNPDPFALKYPSMIDVGIMGSCPNKCAICYQGDKTEPDMTLDNFKHIIDESKYYTNQVALGGRGDPNLHKDFIEIIKYAKENKVAPNYTTSGINLTDEHIAATKEYCGAVAVSDYNAPHTYKAIQRFIDAGVKTNIHFVATKFSMHNVIRLIEGVDIWEGKFDLSRLNAIIFLLFKRQGRGLQLEELNPTFEQTDLFSRAIIQPKSSFKVGMDSCMMNKVLQHREMTESEKLCADTCEAGRMSMYITPDMKVLPCSFGDHDLYGIPFKGETIRKIQTIWNQNEIFGQFREILKQEPNCCPYEELWKQFKVLLAA